MTELYPEIEPYEQGFLEVDNGNRVYWETCGNPHGKPAVVLHGGTGSGCSPWLARLRTRLYPNLEVGTGNFKICPIRSSFPQPVLK